MCAALPILTIGRSGAAGRALPSQVREAHRLAHGGACPGGNGAGQSRCATIKAPAGALEQSLY